MKTLEKQILEANRWIVDKGLVELTWGNVSAKDFSNQTICIKPSGIQLSTANIQDMSVVDSSGALLSGKKPSVDLPTHLELYNVFPEIGCVVHTHSKYATIFAQASTPIPCLGTTHADYFYGEIPCVPHPSSDKMDAYEVNTGKIIGEHFHNNSLNYEQIAACIVDGHGPFVWGKTIEKALKNAYVLEIVAEMAYKSLILNSKSNLNQFIIDKHFLRKHGEQKYYGQ